MTEEKKKKRIFIGLNIDPDVWERFRKHCEEQGFIMGARVEYLIKKYLEEIEN